MPEYLSTEWFAAADALLRADATLRERSRGVHLVIQQTVTDGDGDGELVWHITFDDGNVTMTQGPATAPAVVFVCDRATADAVRTGAESAQSAFIKGRLRIEGSSTALLEHAALFTDLDDVLRPLR